jgi:hypothetical protein
MAEPKLAKSADKIDGETIILFIFSIIAVKDTIVKP